MNSANKILCQRWNGGTVDNENDHEKIMKIDIERIRRLIGLQIVFLLISPLWCGIPATGADIPEVPRVWKFHLDTEDQGRQQR